MQLHIGICGAGIGGLAAAIAIAKAGAKVTILEAAAELGEIGAGIQMTPNASRLLIKWGVDKVIGDNLVEFEELNMRRQDGTPIGYTRIVPDFRENLGVPWWLVHRMHLHAGLAEVARKEGVDIVIDAKVTNIDWKSSKQVHVVTSKSHELTFDILIGADGVNSIVRRMMVPEVKPSPPTGNCAYRAVVPYDQIRADPVARELIEKKTMEVWMAEKAYIISYPISAGKDFNMVLSHHRDNFVDTVEDVDMDELRATYQDFDPRIKRVVNMIPTARRWPLLVTGPLKTWSTPEKNIILMGDAAHSMTNHMAQGAATSMEDGAFLGRIIANVLNGIISMEQGISIYERTRMPKVWYKQQVSFLNGAIWQVPDGPIQKARDKAMSVELQGKHFLRSPNLYGDPQTVLSVYGYDAEKDANFAIKDFLLEQQKHQHQHHHHQQEQNNHPSKATDQETNRILGWWWPKEEEEEKGDSPFSPI